MANKKKSNSNNILLIAGAGAALLYFMRPTAKKKAIAIITAAGIGNASALQSFGEDYLVAWANAIVAKAPTFDLVETVNGSSVKNRYNTTTGTKQLSVAILAPAATSVAATVAKAAATIPVTQTVVSTISKPFKNLA